MATQPRPLGYKARAQVRIAAEHLRHGQRLIADGLRLSDRHPDTAAAHFRDAQGLMVLAENILLRLQLGEFGDD